MINVDPGRTGALPGPGLRAEPRVRHLLTTEGEKPPSVPAAADGVAYVFDSSATLRAFDVTTGKPLWLARDEEVDPIYNADRWTIDNTPTLTDELAIVGEGTLLYAYGRADGRLRWENHPNSGLCPVAVDDLALTVDSLECEEIIAIDVRTGEQRWSVEDVSALETRPTIADGLVLAALGFEPNRCSGGLYAIDLRTGETRWSIEDEDLDGNLWTMAPVHPVLALGLVWMPEAPYDEQEWPPHTLIGRDPATGARRRDLGPFSSAPVFGSGLAFGCGEGTMTATDPVTGTARWTRSWPTPIVGTPVLADDVLHLATEGGGLHALDAATGALLWSLTLDVPTSWLALRPHDYAETATPFTLVDGALYVSVDTGILHLR